MMDAMTTAREETTMEQLDRIAGEYLAGHEIGQTFPGGLPYGNREPLAVSVEGYVNAQRCGADLSLAGSARVIRAALLARAEEMAEAFAAEGWYAESAPRFDFSGSLDHARRQTSGEVVPPQEYGIGLKVRLSLLHLEDGRHHD